MKRLVLLLLVLLLVATPLEPVFAASSEKATTISLAETSGTVTVKNASGKTLTVRKNMPLYNGYEIQTAGSSSAFINLDDEKAIKLDALTKIEVKKSGKQLEITLSSGRLIFDVEKPLKGDESLNIRNVTMVTGVRGSHGWVERLRTCMLHGTAIITCRDIASDSIAVTMLGNGEYVEYTGNGTSSAPSGTQSGGNESATLEGATLEEANHQKSKLTNDDVPAAVADNVRSNDALRELINNDETDLNGDVIADTAADKAAREAVEEAGRLAALEQAIGELDKQIEETPLPVDQVFGDTGTGIVETPVTPDPIVVTPTLHTVTFIVDGETWYTEQVEDGNPIDTSFFEELGSPEKKGYLFLGWTTDPEGETDYVFYDFETETETPVTADLTLYAKFEQESVQPVTYTVTFNTNGGSAIEDVTVEENTAVTKPADPTKEHYTFAGWYSDETFKTEYVFTAPVLEDVTLYAKWTAITHTVTFNTDGGSEIEAVTVDENTAVTKPADPTKDHYTFAGWYSDERLTTAYVFTSPVLSDITLYAKWTSITHTVTFNTDGGSEIEAVTVDENTPVTKPADPTKDHYTFAGWYSDERLTTAYVFTTPVLEDITLYAKWTAITHTVTFNTDGGSEIEAVTVDENTAVTKPADPTKEHYTFDGWYSDEDLTKEYVFSSAVLDDITLYAKWTAITHTVSFNTNGGSLIEDATVDENTAVTKPADPTKDHYTFAGWYSDERLTTAYVFTSPILEDVTLYAKWTAITHTVTFNTDGGSEIEDVTVEENTAVTKPADPTKEHYTFAGWYSDEDLTKEYVFTSPVLDDITLYAKWTAITHTVTFNTNGGSEIEDVTVEENTAVTKPADPTKEHFEFTGWYSDEDLTQEYVFSTAVLDDLTLHAKWTAITHTVTFNTNGGSAVNPVTVEENTAVTKPADPTKDHYTFDGWYSDETFKTEYVFTAPVLEDVTLYAKWIAITHTVSFNTNGGSEIEDVTVDENTAVTKPADPTKDHYTFAGWYSDERLTTAYVFTTPVLEDVILYAKWTAITHSVTFNTDGGSEIATATVDENTAVTKPADPTKDHYTFAGWYSDEDLTKEYVFTSPVLDDITLYARWNLITSAIPVRLEDNQTGIDPIEGDGYTLTAEYIDGTLTSITASAKDGYYFIDWDSVQYEEENGVTFTIPTSTDTVWVLAPRFSSSETLPETITVTVRATRVYALDDLASFDWTGLTEASFAPESTGTTGMITLPAKTTIPEGKTAKLYSLGNLETLSYSDLTVNGTLFLDETVPFRPEEGSTLTIGSSGSVVFGSLETRFYLTADSTLANGGTILSADGESTLFVTVESGATFINNESGSLNNIEFELLGTIVNYGTINGSVDVSENGVIYSDPSDDLTVTAYDSDGTPETVDPTPLSEYNPAP